MKLANKEHNTYVEGKRKKGDRQQKTINTTYTTCTI